MPTLFVANTSKLTHKFQYWPQGGTKLVSHDIKPGTQVAIRDKPKEELDAIVQHHRIYGAIELSEVSRDKAFSGICYNFDKAINVENIQRAADKRNDVIDERAQEIRKETTVALHSQINQQAPGSVDKMDISVEEVGARQDRNAKPALKQKINLVPESGQQRKARRG